MFARQSWGWRVPGMRGVQGKAAGWLIILTGILCKSFPEESASKWRDKLYLMSTTHSFRKLWKTHTLSCIFLTASARGKERDFPLSAFHTNSMFAPEGKPELFLPSYWVSSSFSSLTYLLSVSVSSWSLQASSPQLPPTLTRVSTQPLPEQWFTENVRSTASGKLMKHFINLSTEEILSAQTPRHEIRVWHRHSWIEFFRWLVWKEGFDLHSQTDCESAVNWVSGGGESASFSHECFTNLIQSNNFQKCKGPRFPQKFLLFFQITDI